MKQTEAAKGKSRIHMLLSFEGDTTFGRKALVCVFVVCLFVSAAWADRVRVIIQFSEDSLAQHAKKVSPEAFTARKHLNVWSSAARLYLQVLNERQTQTINRLRSSIPGVDVSVRYTIAFNGVAAFVDDSQLEALRRIPGVIAVTKAYRLEPELDSSPTLLQIPTLWSSLPVSPLGAGAGLRLALIDSGINASHPFFAPAGFSAPAGYPHSYRNQAGSITNFVPVTNYASDKVIVANVYPLPAETNPGLMFPYGAGSDHGTHVAGILGGISGTYTYNGLSVALSGVAPGAYLMSYRVTGETPEYLTAIEDVISDQADALNLSLGHSMWITTDQSNDPLNEALEGAVDAGVIVVTSAGNAGANGEGTITGSFKESPKIITVANSTHQRLFADPVSVSGSPPLQLRPAIPGAAPAPVISSTISAQVAIAPGGTGSDAGLACAALPAGSMTGKIALVKKGTCTYNAKKNFSKNAGAIALIVYQDTGDLPIQMTGFTSTTIPSVMVSQIDGQSMVTFITANPTAIVSIDPLARDTNGFPDLISPSSSRGPDPQLRTIKPDVSAPGTNILSSIVDPSVGTVTSQLFGEFSGTSMSTPHVTALAGLTKAMHPGWTVSQIKSALLNTASTQEWLDTSHAVPATSKDRGAGRVNAARLVDPQITFTPQSLSFGIVPGSANPSLDVAAQNMTGSSTTWNITVDSRVADASLSITPASNTLTLAAGESSSMNISLLAIGTPAGDYEGVVVFCPALADCTANPEQAYTLPYFVRVQDQSTNKQVLLIDWDGSPTFSNYQGTYTAALTALNLSYDVIDGNSLSNNSPSLSQLQKYQTVILMTGNNATAWSSSHLGGSIALQDYVTGGGRLLITGQDFHSEVKYDQNTGTDFNLSVLAGWMDGFTLDPVSCLPSQSDKNFFSPVLLSDVLVNQFDLFSQPADASRNTGGTGPQNILQPDAGRIVASSDYNDPCIGLYNAGNLASEARVLGSYGTTTKNDAAAPRVQSAVATGIAPDRTLEITNPKMNWRAALVHVGLEGLNPELGLSTTQALSLFYDFLNDDITGSLQGSPSGTDGDFTVTANSSRGASISSYRWDFGDGSAYSTTVSPTTQHTYADGVYVVRAEAKDGLTRSEVFSTQLTIDTTAPLVSITSPSDNALVAGIASIDASASDAVTGVEHVDFLIDNISVGSDSSFPYSFTWDTSTYLNATHVLTAEAFDSNGNHILSQPITVTVRNPFFYDDFEDGDALGWTLKGGTWSVVSGVLTGFGLAPTAITPGTWPQSELHGCTVCTFEARVATGGGQVAFNTWYQNNGNALVVSFSSAGKWNVEQRAGGVVVAKRRALRAVVAGQWMVIKAAYDGTNFIVSVDGAELLTLHSAAVPYGNMIFKAQSTSIKVDWVVVY